MRPLIGFDLDGTLVDSLPAITRAANAALAAEGAAPIGEDEMRAIVGRGAPTSVATIRQRRGIAEDRQAAMLAVFLEADHADPDTPLYPSAAEAVETLAREATLVLCTNKVEDLAIKVLERTGIARHFDRVIGGDSLAVRKPDPAVLAAAFDGLGDGPRLYVGDSETDAETAAAAEMPFLLYEGGYRRGPLADLERAASFSRFEDLPGLIRATLAERTAR